MLDLKEITTARRPETDRSGWFGIRLRRAREPWSEVARQMSRVSAEGSATGSYQVELRKGGDAELPEWNIAPAASLLRARRILIPFDFTAAAVRLLRWVVSSAGETGAEISVLHVVHPWVPPAGRKESFCHESHADRAGTARSLLRRLLERIGADASAVHVHVVVGQPVDEIVRLGRTLRADLVVMVPHSWRGLKHPCHSATTERATRRASCPVLVVPEPGLRRWEVEPGSAPASIRRILVPTDLAAASEAALRYAMGLAQEHGAEVYVLNFAATGLSGQVAGPGEAGEAKRLASERLADWIHAKLGHTDGVIPLVCLGKPSAYLLLREAAVLRADLLAFGPRGYSWAERLRLSSSTDAILRNAPCPVLSLRAELSNPGQ